MFAMGREGAFRIRDRAGMDITAQVREDYPAGVAAFDRIIEEANEELERSILRGPTASQVDELKRRGWDPHAARRVAEARAQSEREQADRLSAPPTEPEDTTRWRQDRVRDVVRTRYVIAELMEMI